jgi:hypothetical protein
MTMPSSEWRVAEEWQVVHDLIERSDARAAARSGTPAPQRNPATTKSRVKQGVVHVRFQGGRVVATFTLTKEPPAGVHDEDFPPCRVPHYLQRLAVDPGLPPSDLLGVQALRRAIAVFVESEGHQLRAQVNPDLVEVRTLLVAHGFRACGPVHRDGPVGSEHLYRPSTASWPCCPTTG